MSDQVALDRIGPAIGQILIVFFAADRIGMTGQHEGAALQRRIGQRLAEIVHVRDGGLRDVGRVEVELDLEIDARSGLRDGRDLLALVDGQRARRPVAQRIDELVRLRLLGLFGRRNRKAARQRPSASTR